MYTQQGKHVKIIGMGYINLDAFCRILHAKNSSAGLITNRRKKKGNELSLPP